MSENIPNYAQLSLACQSSASNACCLISVSYHLGGSSLSVSQLIRNHRYLPCAICARVLHILQKRRVNEYSIYFEAALIQKYIWSRLEAVSEKDENFKGSPVEVL